MNVHSDQTVAYRAGARNLCIAHSMVQVILTSALTPAVWAP
jgi:hypothetical protein